MQIHLIFGYGIFLYNYSKYVGDVSYCLNCLKFEITFSVKKSVLLVKEDAIFNNFENKRLAPKKTRLFMFQKIRDRGKLT